MPRRSRSWMKTWQVVVVLLATTTWVHGRDIADLLGIPYDEYTQVAIVSIAYTLGTRFKVTVVLLRQPTLETLFIDLRPPLITALLLY